MHLAGGPRYHDADIRPVKPVALPRLRVRIAVHRRRLWADLAECMPGTQPKRGPFRIGPFKWKPHTKGETLEKAAIEELGSSLRFTQPSLDGVGLAALPMSSKSNPANRRLEPVLPGHRLKHSTSCSNGPVFMASGSSGASKPGEGAST